MSSCSADVVEVPATSRVPGTYRHVMHICCRTLLDRACVDVSLEETVVPFNVSSFEIIDWNHEAGSSESPARRIVLKLVEPDIEYRALKSGQKVKWRMQHKESRSTRYDAYFIRDCKYFLLSLTHPVH